MDHIVEIWKRELSLFETEAPDALQVIQEQELVLGDELGHGSMKEVYTAEWRSMRVAVALLHNQSGSSNLLAHQSQNELRLLLREIAILCTLTHPNVVRVGEQTTHICALLVEYCA